MEQFYQTTLDYIRKHPQLKKSVIFMTQYFPYITFCLYPCVLVYLYLNKSPYLSAAIYKPLGAFLFVTIFRKLINRPRPYDCMNIEPLVGHKHGESFPSRHTLSAFIIALICFYANIYAVSYTHLDVYKRQQPFGHHQLPDILQALPLYKHLK